MFCCKQSKAVIITAATDMTLLVVKNESMLLYGTTNNHLLLNGIDFQTARHRPCVASNQTDQTKFIKNFPCIVFCYKVVMPL